MGGYATPRSDKSNVVPFILNIRFAGRETQRIEATPIDPADPAFTAYPAAPLSIGTDHSAGGNAPGIAEGQDNETSLDEDV